MGSFLILDLVLSVHLEDGQMGSQVCSRKSDSGTCQGGLCVAFAEGFQGVSASLRWEHWMSLSEAL